MVKAVFTHSLASKYDDHPEWKYQFPKKLRSEERRVGKEGRAQRWAEDGIRDFHVTGVQTCALPISWRAQLGLREIIVHCDGSGTGSERAILSRSSEVRGSWLRQSSRIRWRPSMTIIRNGSINSPKSSDRKSVV